MRGGEKVLEALCEIFPDADIFTHVYDPAAISERIKRHKITTTFIARLPWAKRLYKKYLPLMPLALEELDLSAYDLVISCESGPAKGVITRPDALHICYCHTPMRYAWDHYQAYRSGAGFLSRLFIPALMHGLRQWDVTSAARVDHFIANSSFVASRVLKYYRRHAGVIAPPVDVEAFDEVPCTERSYLFASELVSYKRADLAVRAFTQMNKPLIVLGDGEQRKHLERIAGPTIRFMGRVTNETLREVCANCEALVYPGEEDFGIVPVEVMASGRPVIALGRGGVLDTIIDGQTGILFQDQSVEGVIAAVERYEAEKSAFNGSRIKAHARNFSRSRFKTNIVEEIRRLSPGLVAHLPEPETKASIAALETA